jgi:hypothetical protein
VHIQVAKREAKLDLGLVPEVPALAASSSNLDLAGVEREVGWGSSSQGEWTWDMRHSSGRKVLEWVHSGREDQEACGVHLLAERGE